MVTRTFGTLTSVFARRHQLRFIMVLLKLKGGLLNKKSYFQVPTWSKVRVVQWLCSR